MNIRDFLGRLLPDSGLYVRFWISDKPRQAYHNTIEELADYLLRTDQAGHDSYFAIATYSSRIGGRKHDNVHRIKVLSLDIDCGPKKPYPTWKEGLIALSGFIREAKLPRPMIVCSGYGLHVYWVLDTPVTRAEWQPLAEILKQKTTDLGLKVDSALVANAALVLRPIETNNHKHNGVEPVRLLMDAPPILLKQMIAALGADKGAATPIPPAPKSKQKRPVSALAKSLQVYDAEQSVPADPDMVYSKCQQVRWMVDNPDRVDEPAWYALLGVAAHCENPEQTALSWSKGHPDFDADKTLAKLQQWRDSTTGPATCARMQTVRPDGCAGCPYAGKIVTPVQLGVRIETVELEVASPKDAQVAEVQLPRPYVRTAEGIAARIEDGLPPVTVCGFDIYPVSYGMDESLGYEVNRFRWKRPHTGWQPLVFRQAMLTDALMKEFTVSCADQGVVLATQLQTENFQKMLRSYMNELRRIRATTNLYSTMGWKENTGQFVLGETLYRRNEDGTVTEEHTALASASDKLAAELWTTSGSLAAWSAFTTLLARGKLYAHMFALGVSFSAPLYHFAGLKGITVSLYGPTGGGKTLAQYWQQSIWGNPEKLHFAAKFTQNTLFTRLGMYCNLPMTIDEATMVSDKDVGDFLYWVTQGRDKARLDRSAREREPRTWSTPVTVSTNHSWNAKILLGGMDSAAQAARLFEVNVPTHDMFSRNSDAGRAIYNFIHANYGHAGREFIRRLMLMGEDEIRLAVDTALASFKRKYNCRFAGEERFWEQTLVLADLALGWAYEWGIIQFDPAKGIEWAMKQVGAIRRSLEDTRLDAHDILSEYIAEFPDTQIIAYHTGKGQPYVDNSRLPRGEVRMRLDFYRDKVGAPVTKGMLTLDRTYFRKWLAARGLDYKPVVEDIKALGIDATPKSQKAYLGRNTPIKLGQTYAIGINLDHPRTKGMLDDADQNDIPDLSSHLSVVK